MNLFHFKSIIKAGQGEPASHEGQCDRGILLFCLVIILTTSHVVKDVNSQFMQNAAQCYVS